MHEKGIALGTQARMQDLLEEASKGFETILYDSMTVCSQPACWQMTAISSNSCMQRPKRYTQPACPLSRLH